MSGFGAPFLMATPTPARANSTALPATTLPCLTSASNDWVKFATMSPGSLLSSAFGSAGPMRAATMTLWPLAFSKAAARSVTPDSEPMEVKIVISAACGIVPAQPAQRTEHRRDDCDIDNTLMSLLLLVVRSVCHRSGHFFAGSSCALRSSGAASGEVMNLMIACAASCSFDTVSTRRC